MSPIVALVPIPKDGKGGMCRPPSVSAPGRRSGRVATEPCPPPGPRIIVEQGEAVGKPWYHRG